MRITRISAEEKSILSSKEAQGSGELSFVQIVKVENPFWCFTGFILPITMN